MIRGVERPPAYSSCPEEPAAANACVLMLEKRIQFRVVMSNANVSTSVDPFITQTRAVLPNQPLAIVQVDTLKPLAELTVSRQYFERPHALVRSSGGGVRVV